MNESMEKNTEQQAGSTLEAGALLRQAREALGLRIEVLAAALKVPVAKLQALESGRLESMSDMVFVRALAASVCRHVKLDAAVVLAQLPLPPSKSSVMLDEGLNATVKLHHGGGGRWGGLTRPVIWAVLALFIATALILSWPKLRAAAWSTTAAAPPMATEMASSEVVSNLLTSSLPATVVPPPPPSAVWSTPTALAEPKQPGAAAEEVLQLRARSAAWARVRDANKTLVFEKLLRTNEVAAVSGRLPLSVELERADLVEVKVRGQVLVPSTEPGSQAARFTVQ